MKYLYILLFVSGAILLQTNALGSKLNSDNQFDIPQDEYIYSSVSFVSDDCGTVTIDGWSSWSNGSCTGYCYDISSDCGSSNVSGANDPGNMLNNDGTISARFMKSRMSAPLQY